MYGKKKIKQKKREKEKENELNRKYVNLYIPKHHSFQSEKGEEKFARKYKPGCPGQKRYKFNLEDKPQSSDSSKLGASFVEMLIPLQDGSAVNGNAIRSLYLNAGDWRLLYRQLSV